MNFCVCARVCVLSTLHSPNSPFKGLTTGSDLPFKRLSSAYESSQCNGKSLKHIKGLLMILDIFGIRLVGVDIVVLVLLYRNLN